MSENNDDDLAAFEDSERLRKRKIYRVASAVWGVLGVLALVLGIVANYHPAFVWVGAIALLIGAMYASGRSFTTLI